jgi:hypothetical protein
MPGGRAEIVAIGFRGADVNPVRAIGEVNRLLRRLASDGVELSEAANVSKYLNLRPIIVRKHKLEINQTKQTILARTSKSQHVIARSMKICRAHLGFDYVVHRIKNGER